MHLLQRLCDTGKKVAKWPFFPVFAIALTLQVIGEQFPFSPFPMYAGFGEDSASTSVVFVTDAQDHALAIGKYFRLDASKLKKNYVKTLDQICHPRGYDDPAGRPEDIREAGIRTVDFLQKQVRNPKLAEHLKEIGLRIYRTKIVRTAQGIEQSTEYIGGTR